MYDEFVDYNDAIVEIEIRVDGKVVWLNVDGTCRARISKVKELHILDYRLEGKKPNA